MKKFDLKEFSDYLFNASCLHNHSCHLPFHGEHMKRENQVKFIKKNAERLAKEGYELNENDINFLTEHNLLEFRYD